MKLSRWFSKNSRSLLGSVVGACIVVYFVYHAVQGDRGMVAMLQLQNQVRDAQHFLSQVREQRETLEHRVKLMGPNGVDPDLLEEQSRSQLNTAKPNEWVVITKPDNGTETGKKPPQRSK